MARYCFAFSCRVLKRMNNHGLFRLMIPEALSYSSDVAVIRFLLVFYWRLSTNDVSGNQVWPIINHKSVFSYFVTDIDHLIEL